MHAALIPSEAVDDFIVIHARAFARKVQRAMVRDVLVDEKLPVLEWQLLFSVARFGSCHLAHITRRTSIYPAHGSRAIASLEKKGMIERREDPKNKRRKLISLTSRGVETFERIWPRARQIVKSVTDQLDPQDFGDLKRLMALSNTAAAPLVEGQDASEHQQNKETEETSLTARVG
ncbi:MAG: MarR family winged helix-turn-helix transcriptional regulator [Tateyamaria sp.]